MPARMKSTAELVRVKQAMAWIEEQRAIHIKAALPKGEPVELTAAEARRFAERLAKLADVLDSLDEPEP
ncbi:MAG: hypothetical protein IPH07_30555 [Deltaproteobacteria bacterium]|nr:hypothetical protein [Deltaproteobacteria bacterium]MBK8234516.1 hypothetical protein [Deltaproteobacteria bacterium]MBK8715258.1 hypothetical protein [Deltaproteobacteria bacterium]